MNHTVTWKHVLQSLEADMAVMLLYVMESKGSSPGRQGFFMAVNAEGKMEGSIGGGIMEHKFVELAKEKLKILSEDPAVTYIRKQYHDKSAAKDQSGMICSGEQTILLYQAKQADRRPLEQIIASLEANKNATLILHPTGIWFDAAVPERDYHFVFHGEHDWLYQEKLGFKNQLFIIGGGHCGLALSRLMSQMDFYTHIYDERADLKTMNDNEAANEKHFIEDYTKLKGLIPSGKNHYVVIMTFGYRTDDIALRALLDKDFAYIGLLGSQYKIEKLFEDYRKEGINGERLQRVHTPIGVSIKSQTPEEIAVSIAAEIIQVKNKNL